MQFLHNINFYINMIKGLNESLNFDVFPTYINTVSNMGYLSFEHSVVPHLFLYIPTFINRYINDISLSLNLFILFINFLQFIFMFICLSGITKKKLESFLASILYVSIFLISINTTTVLGLSEHFAIAIVPLFIYAINNLYHGNSKSSILIIISLFLIGETSITIFALSIIFTLIYSIINIINSIFKLKIFTVIFYIIVSILLLSFTYVPIIDYYLSKQVTIVNIIGNNAVLITTVIFFVLLLIYILLSKIIINKSDNRTLNIIISIAISLLFIISISIYGSIFKLTDRLVIKDKPYEETVYIPIVTEEYLDANNDRINEIFEKDGYGYFNIYVKDYTQSYLQMNIDYETNEKYDEYFLDMPYYYIKGLRASNDKGKAFKTMLSEEGLMRVFLPKESGVLHISYKNPILYDISNIVSIITFILMLIIISINELKDFKGEVVLKKKEEIVPANSDLTKEA